MCVVVVAVGALALSSSDVQEVLRRCVETEEEAELRLAACRLLQSTGAPSAQLQDFCCSASTLNAAGGSAGNCVWFRK